MLEIRKRTNLIIFFHNQTKEAREIEKFLGDNEGLLLKKGYSVTTVFDPDERHPCILVTRGDYRDAEGIERIKSFVTDSVQRKKNVMTLDRLESLWRKISRKVRYFGQCSFWILVILLYPINSYLWFQECKKTNDPRTRRTFVFGLMGLMGIIGGLAIWFFKLSTFVYTPPACIVYLFGGWLHYAHLPKQKNVFNY